MYLYTVQVGYLVDSVKRQNWNAHWLQPKAILRQTLRFLFVRKLVGSSLVMFLLLLSLKVGAVNVEQQ